MKGFLLMKKFLTIFLTVILAVAIMAVTAVAAAGVTKDENGIFCTNLLDFNKETNELWAKYDEATDKWSGTIDYTDQYAEVPLDANGYPITPVLHEYSSYSARRWSLIEDGEVLHIESTDSSIYPGVAFMVDLAQDGYFQIGRETNNPAKAEYAKIRVRNFSVCDQITFGFVLKNTNNGKFVQATITELTKDANGKVYGSSGEWETYTFSMYDVNMNTNYSELIYDPAKEGVTPSSRWGGQFYEMLIFPFGYDVSDGTGNYPGAAIDIDYMVLGSRAYVDSYQSALEIKEGNIASLELVKAPTKTNYYVGEALDLDGLELKATYKDGTVETLNTASASVSTFNDVVNTVTLKFGKEEVSYSVNVTDITGIEVNKIPEDTVFEVEELADGFVSDGFQIKVNYADGTSKISDISPSAENGALLANASFAFTGDFTTAGAKTVTVYYFGKSTTFDITTIQVTDIEVTAKKSYRYNSKPNFENDFTVELVFSDGSKLAKADATIEFEYNLECDVKAPGTVKAKITATNSDYGLTFTKEVDVTVEAPTAVEVTTPPTKTEYNPGEAFSAKGMVVSLIYEDGKKVTVDAADYTTKVNTANPGNKSVQIRTTIPGLDELFESSKLKTSITVVGGSSGDNTQSTTGTTGNQGGSSSSDNSGIILPIIIVAAVLVIGAVVVVVLVVAKKKKK
jgi:hypothetical protein